VQGKEARLSSVTVERMKMERDYDAILSDWVICIAPTGAMFLAGKLTADRRGASRDGTYISTSAVQSSPERVADGSIVQTLDTRYLLTDRYSVDDEIFAKLDAWIAEQPKPPLLGDVLATRDVQLIGAYILRGFRAATAEAVWRRDHAD
jgi:hypothetical protein